MNMNFTPNPSTDPNILKKYGRDLTDLAAAGKLDPVIGRDEEILRLIRILSRRTKNNPVLIGEPGVGKTAIVEALAFKIINEEVPDVLKGKSIVELQLSSIIAGAKFQGEFEERLKSIIDKIEKSNGEIIAFIDEIHTLVGTGANMNSTLDASNILKPSLARGTIRLVGATTNEEYRKYIEKDAALERRLQKISINEPSIVDTIAILRGLKSNYETFHGVRIHDNALTSAVSLSTRYIQDRFLPDKAIDLIDEACSEIKTLADSQPDELVKKQKKLAQLEMEVGSLKKEKDKQSISRLKEINQLISDLKPEVSELNKRWNKERKLLSEYKDNQEEIKDLKYKVDKLQREGSFEEAGKIVYQVIPNMERNLKKFEEKIQKNNLIREEVNSDVVADIVSKWTGIPTSSLLISEREKLSKLEEDISKIVKGQYEAIEKVSNAIRRTRSGIADPSKPIGSFIFMGPTGVGKTEVARQLAKVMFDSKKSMIRLDMSEYSEKNSISKIIGAPPGYVGHDQGGSLTELVRRKPYSIILLDEIEKAHREIFDVFLQILDEGRLTDAKGRTVDFNNSIIIMTSNIGSQLLSDKKKYNHQDYIDELMKFFRPEFINRIDEIIVFNSLDAKTYISIVEKELLILKERLLKQNYYVNFNKKVISKVAKESYNNQFGARPIKRYITYNIENFIANLIISGKLKNDRKIVITVDTKGNISLEKRKLN